MQMKQNNTLTARITKNLMLWVGLIWIISAVGVAAYVKYEIDEAFDQALLDNTLQIDRATQIATSMAHRADAFWETMRWLFLPMLAFLPALAFIVQRIVRGELNPVQQLTDQLAERGAQNLTVLRANEGFPSELITIVESTNRLLERMDSALDVERSLAANAAHELRTPIATARLRIDNAMQHDLPEAAKIELVAAMAGLVQLTRRAEKLLQLSRAEGSQSLNSERMDLAHLASLVVQEFWADAGVQRRLYLDLTAMDGADIASVWVMGDMDTLALALRNLIENALRHSTDADVTLRVRRSEDGLTALASVIDQGLGLSSDQITKLSKRHVRYSTDQTGFGLGLSIVKTIVERQKGRLAFTSPPAGLTQGLEVRIELRTA
jgi:two-component system, OmpR family, sensor kinase